MNPNRFWQTGWKELVNRNNFFGLTKLTIQAYIFNA